MIKYILLVLLLLTSAHANDRIVVTKIEKEIKCLADNIYFEARNESIKGQVAVASVTKNRVNSKYYPDTICKVVWEHRQFSWTLDGKSDTPRNKKAYAAAELIAIVFVNTTEIIDVTKGATHYHNTSVNPYWSSKLTYIMTIDNHIFYKFKK